MPRMFLADNIPESTVLEHQIDARLAARLESDHSLTQDEIDKVSSLNRKLFPEEFRVDEATCENIRVLAKLSQMELRPASEIRSHRKVIGPLIVFIKRLTWPLIRIHLKQSYDSMRELHSRTVVMLAQQAVEIARLKGER